MAQMNAKEFVDKAITYAKTLNTVYALGMYGHLITDANIETKAKQYPSWYTESVKKSLRSLVGKNYWGFDCVCYLKAIINGFNADTKKSLGGAVYNSIVPDLGANQLFNKCTDISSDFSKIIPGEAVWMDGHIGVYVGDGLAVECTVKWDRKVQITACNCTKAGYNRRDWTKHGKLPYIDYSNIEKPTTDKMVSVEVQTLKIGTPKYEIKALQTLLNLNGAKIDVDGIFGSATEKAVKDFQTKNNLAVDGIVGKATWSKLING